MQKNKNKKKTIAVCAALIGVMAIGGMSAYFTDHESAENKFVVGKVDIDLTEPNWSKTDENHNDVPDAAEGLTPNKVLAKDPMITLKDGSAESYVFMTVKIPKGTDEKIELFKMLKTVEGTDSEGFNAKWTELSEKETSTDDYKIYVFAYDDPLTAGQSTNKLFDKVRFANIASDTVASNQQIDVNAYAIQKDNLGTTDKVEIWTILQNSLN